MAMKKTSSGDFPLRQCAGKSFWTLPISSRWRRRIAMCFWKLIGYLGFSHRGVFIGEGATSEVNQGGHTRRGRGQGLGRTALLCGRPMAMVVSISIRILVCYDFTILPRSIDTYRDGILIWVVSYSYPDTYHDIFSIPIQKRYNTIPHLR
jgi:hypothetical protein